MLISTDSQCLGACINEATAKKHAFLEDIVMSHFRKCLFPAASTPLLYAKGLSYFLLIFCKLDLVLRNNDLLYDQKLERTPGLNADILRINADFQEADKRLELDVQEWTPALKDFSRRMGEQIYEKPYLLLAHAWVFYLAIFSGGKYMKASLHMSFQNAWLQQLEEGDKTRPCADTYLRFWTFGNSVQESEEIRSNFKKRFKEVAKTLSIEQREEVVDEARGIMDSLFGIIQELGVLLEPHGEAAQESAFL